MRLTCSLIYFVTTGLLVASLLTRTSSQSCGKNLFFSKKKNGTSISLLKRRRNARAFSYKCPKGWSKAEWCRKRPCVEHEHSTNRLHIPYELQISLLFKTKQLLIIVIQKGALSEYVPTSWFHPVGILKVRKRFEHRLPDVSGKAFIILIIDRSKFSGPVAAFEATRPKVRKVIDKFRNGIQWENKIIKFNKSYCVMLEFHKDEWPQDPISKK